MERINLDHWFIDKNKLSIALMNFYVEIGIKFDEEKKSVVTLKVHNSDLFNKKIAFNTIEEAVIFTENIITRCRTLEDVIEAYEHKDEENRLKR